MESCVCHITGGSFESAGEASTLLKQALKRIGVEPELIRRASIAAYEAEMNVVIHARRGRLEARISPDRIEVEVADEGPGIADIALAMKEGYSTASDEARALGFGAGMGLPNIKRCADSLNIESNVGAGTRLHFTVMLKKSAETAASRYTPALRRERCNNCLQCLKACPTGALRVRNGWPMVLEHLCINCAECMRACATRVISLPATGREEQEIDACGRTIALPSALAQYLADDLGSVEKQLLARGFRRVLWIDLWREAVSLAANDGSPAKPTLAPICPAVVALIETRYPALIGNLAPVRTPVESLVEQVESPLLLVALCPGEAAALRESDIAMSPNEFLRWLGVQMPGIGEVTQEQTTSSDPSRTTIQRTMGMAEVIAALEAIEDGREMGAAVLELCACRGGCSPLQGPTCITHSTPLSPTAAPLRVPRKARPGLRLDAEMAEAIRKLGRMDDLLRQLPGKDCARCGAPSCRALAEDVVMGRAARMDCPDLRDNKEGAK